MQDGYQATIEPSGQTVPSPDGGFEREQNTRRAGDLEAKVNLMEGALRGLGDALGQMREQIREIGDHYREVLDKHDQLVVYIQSSMQYCENKDAIDALFEASDKNSLTAAEIDKKLEALEERITEAEKAAALGEKLESLEDRISGAEKATKLNKKLKALEERIAMAEEAAQGKMPINQGEQLLKVLKIHHGKISELYDLINE